MNKNAVWLYAFHDSRIEAFHGKIEPDYSQSKSHSKFYSDALLYGYPLTVSKYEKTVECYEMHALYAFLWLKERDDELAKKIFEAYFEFRIAKIDTEINDMLDRFNMTKEMYKNAITCVKAIDISNTEVLK